MARVTNIITSIDSNTSESVTIDTAWTGTDGDLVLSASVPTSVKVGDTITDSAANTYLITGISGSTLTSQDFDSTTDPATGSATIQDAYAGATGIGLWEADLDDTIIYASSDDAIGEMYNNLAFDESITFNGGATVGLNSIKLTVPSTERHDGTAGTGARIVRTDATGETLIVNTPDGFTDSYIFEWFEIDDNDQGAGWVTTVSANSFENSVYRNMIMHESASGGKVGGILANNRGALVINCILYNFSRSTSIDVSAVHVRVRNANSGVINCTVFNTGNPGSGNARGIAISDDDADGSVRNNISVDTTVGGAGTASDFVYPGSNPTITNNMSGDATADDQGTNHVISVTLANQFVDTVDGMEDLHLKSGSDAIDAGFDLGTSPTGVNFDINNRDRDAEGDTWDIGAHELVSTGIDPSLEFKRVIDKNTNVLIRL